MTASPGDGEHAAREGYYPDPSIPGFVRYWNGAAWVPGTSRPAPAVPVPGPAPMEETGPVFLDDTSATETLPEPAPAATAEPEREAEREAESAGEPVWQADRLHQAGFGGPRDHRVSWGSPAEPADAAYEPVTHEPVTHEPAAAEPAAVAEYGSADRYEPAGHPAGAVREPAVRESAVRAAGVSLGRHRPEAADEPGGPGVSLARTPAAAAAAPAARFPAQVSAGILSARSPAASAAAPAPAAPAPAWPDAPGGSGRGAVSGLTSSWPGASPRAAASAPAAPRPAEAAPAPAPEAPAREEAAREEAAPRRADPAAIRPAAPRPAAAKPAPRPAPVRPAPAVPAPARPAAQAPVAAAAASGWQPRAGGARPSLPEPEEGARTARGTTPRAVFERMAERAARPAGLGRRVVARVLDSLVCGAVAAAVALPLVPAATAHLQAKVDAARAGGRTTTVWLFDTVIATDVGLVLGAVLLFGVFYEVLPTARWGRTPGKKLLGVRVLATGTLRPPTFGAALRRWLVYAFLGLPGSLWCLFDRPRRRGWHDRAAGTYVSR